jgi:hypothetical protein
MLERAAGRIEAGLDGAAEVPEEPSTSNPPTRRQVIHVSGMQ